LDAKKALQAYHSQKHNAKRRGIGWELTFKEWCDFWGEDIDRRGTKRGCLQMQRHMDAGPYKLGNIKKGEPRDNVRTRECAQWDKGRRIKPTLFVPRYDPADDDDEPSLGYASMWARMIG